MLAARNLTHRSWTEQSCWSRPEVLAPEWR